MPLTSQMEDPRFSLYRENQLWTMGEVVFATAHVVGSNNNLGRTAEMDREYEARNAANLAWIRTAFRLARDGGFTAVMLIMQANPRYDFMPGDPRRSGFEDTIAVLEEETLAFGKLTLLVHGDTHYFRIDKPLVGTQSRRRVERFTRLETFGAPDMHWVRARVEPRNPNLFVFEQGIVEDNLVKH